MNRRGVLGIFFKGSVAAASGGLFARASEEPLKNDDHGLSKYIEENITFKDQTVFAKTYGITVPENAENLLNAVHAERVKLYAAAGAISSGTHTATTKLPLDHLGTIGSMITRLLTTNALSGAVYDLSPLISSNNLASPQYVAKEYGLSEKNAERFCNDFQTACINGMSGITKAVSSTQELISLIKPPKKEQDAPVIDLAPR